MSKERLYYNILNKIIDIQLYSYNKILTENDPMVKVFLQQFKGCNGLELNRVARDMIEFYNRLKNSPEKVLVTSRAELAAMRYILYHMEEEWIIEDPIGVADTWKFLFLQEELQMPNIGLTLKIYKDGKEK